MAALSERRLLPILRAIHERPRRLMSTNTRLPCLHAKRREQHEVQNGAKFMAEGTKIEWTHRPGTIPATMNALVGCQKVSQGCANCYAIEVAHIRAGNPLPVMQEKFAGTTKVAGGKRIWTGKVTLS